VGELDFEGVIAAHQQWRVTLRNAALKNKPVDASTVSRDDCCALGKWIYGPGGSQWGKEPSFTQLVSTHKAFHQEAGRVAEAINRGDVRGAQSRMDSGQPFVEAGHQVTLLLRRLREMVQGTRPTTQARTAPPPRGKFTPKVSAPKMEAPLRSGSAPVTAPARHMAPADSNDGDWETF
jgi:aerotaxis receptor